MAHPKKNTLWPAYTHTSPHMNILHTYIHTQAHGSRHMNILHTHKDTCTHTYEHTLHKHTQACEPTHVHVHRHKNRSIFIIKIQVLTNVKNVKKQETCMLVVEMYNSTAILNNKTAVPCNTKHRWMIQSSNTTSEYPPRGVTSVHAKHSIEMFMAALFIHNSQNKNNSNVCQLTINKENVAHHTWTIMDEFWTHYISGRSQK